MAWAGPARCGAWLKCVGAAGNTKVFVLPAALYYSTFVLLYLLCLCVAGCFSAF